MTFSFDPFSINLATSENSLSLTLFFCHTVTYIDKVYIYVYYNVKYLKWILG